MKTWEHGSWPSCQRVQRDRAWGDILTKSLRDAVDPITDSMPRNIEIKARVEDLATLAARVAAMANQGSVELTQEDTFFTCDTGRLKLRRFSSEQGELIYYRRPDQQGPKESFYLRSTTTDPGGCVHLSPWHTARSVRSEKNGRCLWWVGRESIWIEWMVWGIFWSWKSCWKTTSRRKSACVKPSN